MLLGAAIAGLFIVGLFFEMLASSPKTEVKQHSDTQM
jgi:hypothetical protein